jgi:hypothetical protein
MAWAVDDRASTGDEEVRTRGCETDIAFDILCNWGAFRFLFEAGVETVFSF